MGAEGVVLLPPAVEAALLVGAMVPRGSRALALEREVYALVPVVLLGGAGFDETQYCLAKALSVPPPAHQ